MTAIGNDKRNRQELSTKYDEILHFYHKLSKQHEADLDQFLSGVEKNIETRKKELQHSDCTILIAGKCYIVFRLIMSLPFLYVWLLQDCVFLPL